MALLSCCCLEDIWNLEGAWNAWKVENDSDLKIVKLHSDLKILTQLQLVGVGVDFVFPLEEGEGRKEELTPT